MLKLLKLVCRIDCKNYGSTHSRGSFLSASLQVLFDKLTSPSLHEFESVWGVEHELTRLRRTLLKILSVMGSMEMREIRDQSMQIWLKELKDVAYDADDILDEFEAEVLRQHVNNINQVSYFSLIPNQVIFRHEISKKINTIRERLDDAARDRDDLRLGDLKHKTIGATESSSLVAKSCVFGREDDTEKIVEVLISKDTNHPTDTNVHVMLIAGTGMGGIGKTTLAKLVYNDERIDSYFQLKMWVDVSQEFSVKKITREMTEFCSKGRNNDLGN